MPKSARDALEFKIEKPRSRDNVAERQPACLEIIVFFLTTSLWSMTHWRIFCHQLHPQAAVCMIQPTSLIHSIHQFPPTPI